MTLCRDTGGFYFVINNNFIKFFILNKHAKFLYLTYLKKDCVFNQKKYSEREKRNVSKE